MGKMIIKDYVTTTDATWTVKQLCDYAEQELVTFDNAVQRDYVWSLKDNSLLIHSSIVNYMPPEFLANKKDGIYDMIDGKQRHNAYSKFLNDKYKLTSIPTVTDSNGIRHDFNGKLFSELPEEVREKITGRGLKISVMDNAPQSIVKEYFYRRNAGVQLTATRKTFSQAASFDEISEMAKHPVFDAMLSKKSDDKIGVVMRTFVLLNCESKSLESRKVESYVKRAKFSDDKVRAVLSVYDTILAAHDLINKNETKDSRKIAKLMMKKTHIIAMVPVAEYANNNGIGAEMFAKWILHFFAGNSLAGVSISTIYNESTSTGTAKEAAVKARVGSMMEDFIEFIGGRGVVAIS